MGCGLEIPSHPTRGDPPDQAGGAQLKKMNINPATGKAAQRCSRCLVGEPRSLGGEDEFQVLGVSPGALLDTALGGGRRILVLLRRSRPRQVGCGCLSLFLVQESVAPRRGLWLLCPLRSEPKRWELLGWGGGCSSRTSPGKRKFTKHTSATYVSDVPNLLHVLCWVLSRNYDPSVYFRGPERCCQPGFGYWHAGCCVVGGCQGQGAGKEVPSPPLSGRVHLVFLTVIAASVWLKLNWEMVTGGTEGGGGG